MLCLVAIVITMAVNVPLNEELVDAGLPASETELAAIRDRFEDPWVAWNVVRTVAATAAAACLLRALVLRGRADGPARA